MTDKRKLTKFIRNNTAAELNCPDWLLHSYIKIKN